MQNGVERQRGWWGASWRGLVVGLVLVVLGVGAARTVMEAERGSAPEGVPVEEVVAVAGGVEADSSGPRAGTGPAWDISNLDHPRVDHFVEVFTGPRRQKFAGFLERMGRYEPMISAKLAERGMPQDLIYLAMIESGFEPRAYSRARASGLWQFIAETGRRYGLELNRAVDERNDPERATDAALDYLQELYDRFGSWYLAAAAYNTGENRVGRIMRQVTGSERGTDSSYYRIWNRLPRETRDYVPLMIAAARITKERERYGFGDVEPAPALAYDTVVVPPATPLPAIAKAAGTTVTELRSLNPHFRLNRTRNDRASPVRVPAGSKLAFAENWPAASRETFYATSEPAVTTSYRVRRGDSLIRIAKRHGTTVVALKQANGLRSDRIFAGNILQIPAR